jgi:hypothetical protein
VLATVLLSSTGTKPSTKTQTAPGALVATRHHDQLLLEHWLPQGIMISTGCHKAS